jgi:hypothetical protein
MVIELKTYSSRNWLMLVVFLKRDRDGRGLAGSHLKAQPLFHIMTGMVHMEHHAIQMSVMKIC